MLPPAPWRSAIAGLLTVGTDWHAWFRQLAAAIDGSAQRVGSSSLTTQGAALPTTTIATLTATGLYRVSYYARITRAATTSSSLTVTVRWVDGGIAQVFSGAALTGNTTTTSQGDSRIIQADTGTAITVETTYASVGGTSMQYSLNTRVEALP